MPRLFLIKKGDKVCQSKSRAGGVANLPPPTNTIAVVEKKINIMGN
jgi:hypothetical protein